MAAGCLKQSVGFLSRHVPMFEVMGNHEALIDAWAPGWAWVNPAHRVPKPCLMTTSSTHKMRLVLNKKAPHPTPATPTASAMGLPTSR